MNQQVSAIQTFRAAMEGNMRQEIAKALPKGIDVDRFIRTVITTVQINPELLNANRSSLFASCMQAAKDGLLPDGKEATIQIHNTNMAKKGEPANWVKLATYMPMVRGLVRKMYEAGCTKVDAAAVYERDHFEYLRGDDDCIRHAPYMGMEEPGPVVASYAIVKLSNGEIKREVMTRRDIEKIRAASKSANGPGWTNWYDQFAIKSVLKRIYKQLPDRDEALERLIENDNSAMGVDLEAIEQAKPKAIAASTAGRSSRLDAIVGQGIKDAVQVEAGGEEAEAEQSATEEGGTHD